MAQPRPQNQVDQDIAIIVGGSFSPDHIGPTAHQQIVRRVRAAPDRYLQAFERRFLRSGVDPLIWLTCTCPRSCSSLPTARRNRSTRSAPVLPRCFRAPFLVVRARIRRRSTARESPTNPRESADA